MVFFSSWERRLIPNLLYIHLPNFPVPFYTSQFFPSITLPPNMLFPWHVLSVEKSLFCLPSPTTQMKQNTRSLEQERFVSVKAKRPAAITWSHHTVTWQHKVGVWGFGAGGWGLGSGSGPARQQWQRSNADVTPQGRLDFVALGMVVAGQPSTLVFGAKSLVFTSQCVNMCLAWPNLEA